MSPYESRMPNLFRLLTSCALVLGTAGCGGDAGAAPGQPAAPPPAALLAADPADTLSLAERDSIAGRIAFIAERDGNKELYSVRPTGGGELRLTHRPEQDFPGTVRPDGSDLLVISLEGDGPLAWSASGWRRAAAGRFVRWAPAAR